MEYLLREQDTQIYLQEKSEFILNKFWETALKIEHNELKVLILKV